MRSRWFGLVIAAWPWLSPYGPTRNSRRPRDALDLCGRRTLFQPSGGVTIMPLVILGLTGLFNVLPQTGPAASELPKSSTLYWLIANPSPLLLIGHG